MRGSQPDASSRSSIAALDVPEQLEAVWAQLRAGGARRLPERAAVSSDIAEVALLTWLGDLQGARELCDARAGAGAEVKAALDRAIAETGRAGKASMAFFPRRCREGGLPGKLDVRVQLEHSTYAARDGTAIGLVHAQRAAPPDADGGSAEPLVVVRWGGNAEMAAEVVRPGTPWEEMVAAGLVRLIAVDYRGFGWSGGTATPAALRADVADLLASLPAWHAARGLAWPPARPPAAMGRSLGAQAALHLAALLAGRCSALVLDSPAVCHWPLEQVGTAQWESLSAALAEAGAPPLPPAGRRLEHCDCCRTPAAGRAQPALEAASLDSYDLVAGLRLPLLMLVGTADFLCPAPQIEDFLAHAAAPAEQKKLVWLEGRSHNEVFFSREYWEELAGFFYTVQNG